MSATKNKFTALLGAASRFAGIGAVGPAARDAGLNREVHKIEYWLDSGHDWKASGERVDEEQTERHLVLQKKFDSSLTKLPTEPDTADVTQVALGRLLARDDGFIDLTRGSVDLPRFGSDVAGFSDAILPGGSPVLMPFQCACASETLQAPAFYAALRAIAQFDGNDVPIQVCDVKHVDLDGPSILSVGGAHRVDAGGQPTVKAREEGRTLPFPRYEVELPAGTARWEFTPDAFGNAQWDVARPSEAFVYVDRVTKKEYRINFGRLADGPFTGLARISGFLTIYTESDNTLTVKGLIDGAEGRPTPNDEAIAAFLVEQKKKNTPVETIQRVLEAVKFCGDDTLTELARVNRATLFTTGDTLAWIMAIKKGIPCCVFTHGHDAHVWYDYRGNPAAAAAAAAAFKVQRGAVAALRAKAYESLCRTIQRMLEETRSVFEKDRQAWVEEWAAAAKVVPGAVGSSTDLRKWVSALQIARDRVREMSVENRQRLMIDAYGVLSSGDDEDMGAAAAGGGGGAKVRLPTGALEAGEYNPAAKVPQRYIPDINLAIARLSGGVPPSEAARRGAGGRIFTSMIEEAAPNYRDPRVEYQALISIVLALLQNANSGNRRAIALLESVGVLFPEGAASAAVDTVMAAGGGAAAAGGGGGGGSLAGVKRGRQVNDGGGAAPLQKAPRTRGSSDADGAAAAAGGGGGAAAAGGGGRRRRGGGLDERDAICDRITAFLTRLLRYNIYLRSRTQEGVATIINLADVVESLEALNARAASEGITLSDDEDMPLLRFPAGTIRRDLFLTLLQSVFGNGEASGDTVNWSSVQFILDYFLRDNHYAEDDPVLRIVGTLTEETLNQYDHRLTEVIDKATAGEEVPPGGLMTLITGIEGGLVQPATMIPFDIPTSEQMAAAALRAPASDFTADLPPEGSSALLEELLKKYSTQSVSSSVIAQSVDSLAMAQAPALKSTAPVMAGGRRKITRKRHHRARKTRRM
jgi:hypothetical protein